MEEDAQGVSGRLAASAGLTLCLMAAEIVAGLLANSLALLTDAAHNATDVLALVLSWYAVRLAQRPAHSGKTYVYHRAGILAALVNSTTLVVVALGVFYEAYRRLISPLEVRAGILISVAVVAFGINLATALLIRRDRFQARISHRSKAAAIMRRIRIKAHKSTEIFGIISACP
jgi:cobalt-zinc-cadmium efflux system protein